MRSFGVRRWSALSRVERVDAYTRQSQYLLMWGFGASLTLSGLTDPDADAGAATTVAVVVGWLVVTAAGVAVLRAVIEAQAAGRGMPWRGVGVLVVLCVAHLLVVGLPAPDSVRAAVLVVAVVNLAAAVGAIPGPRLMTAIVLGSAAMGWLSARSPIGAVAAAVVALFVIFSVRVSLWMLSVVTELDAARQVHARLAVAEERLRFSRDVHDVLGRRLSTIAVQAELAATLAVRGDERAADRMLDVRGVAHEALAEARELARGYRPTDLTTELDGARSLLRSAGIEVRLAVDVVPRAWHEAAGWVVREAVTNVLRHSAATTVTLTWTDSRLVVENDGVRAPSDDGGDDGGDGGSGLQGLRERLAPFGATLTAGPSGSAPDHWTVAAHLPGSGPLSATTGGIA